MTTITEKITTAIQPLNAFEDPLGNNKYFKVNVLEFGELCKLVRNDLLGFQ